MRFIHRANRTTKATLKLYSFHQVWVMQDVHIFIKCRASKGQCKTGTMKFCMKATSFTFTCSFALSTIGLGNCPVTGQLIADLMYSPLMCYQQ